MVRLVHHRWGRDMHGPSNAWMLAAAVHVSLVAATSASFAQSQASGPAAAATRPAGDDIVHTKNGGLLRGTIIEVLPDVQARIQLATGEIATVPWSQVDRIEHMAAPSAPASAAGPSDNAAPKSEVWVHLEAPDGVLLQQDVTNDDNWRTVCAAPCDKLLPTAFYYRVTGGGIRSSADFVLRGSPGTRERLVVDGASKSALVLGIIGLSAGGLAAYIGLFVAAAGASAGLVSDGDGGSGGSSNAAGVGLAMLGIGVLAAAGGLALVVSNSSTTVDQSVGGNQAGLVMPGPWTRTPTWSAAAIEQKNLPPVMGIPIFSGRF
jgi:hypothetical protein